MAGSRLDPYKILGITESSSLFATLTEEKKDEHIKERFHTLVREAHPDAKPGSKPDYTVEEITKAFNQIKNSTAREKNATEQGSSEYEEMKRLHNEIQELQRDLPSLQVMLESLGKTKQSYLKAQQAIIDQINNLPIVSGEGQKDIEKRKTELMRELKQNKDTIQELDVKIASAPTERKILCSIIEDKINKKNILKRKLIFHDLSILHLQAPESIKDPYNYGQSKLPVILIIEKGVHYGLDAAILKNHITFFVTSNSDLIVQGVLKSKDFQSPKTDLLKKLIIDALNEKVAKAHAAKIKEEESKTVETRLALLDEKIAHTLVKKQIAQKEKEASQKALKEAEQRLAEAKLHYEARCAEEAKLQQDELNFRYQLSYAVQENLNKVECILDLLSKLPSSQTTLQKYFQVLTDGDKVTKFIIPLIDHYSSLSVADPANFHKYITEMENSFRALVGIGFGFMQPDYASLIFCSEFHKKFPSVRKNFDSSYKRYCPYFIWLVNNKDLLQINFNIDFNFSIRTDSKSRTFGTFLDLLKALQPERRASASVWKNFEEQNLLCINALERALGKVSPPSQSAMASSSSSSTSSATHRAGTSSGAHGGGARSPAHGAGAGYTGSHASSVHPAYTGTHGGGGGAASPAHGAGAGYTGSHASSAHPAYTGTHGGGGGAASPAHGAGAGYTGSHGTSSAHPAYTGTHGGGGGAASPAHGPGAAYTGSHASSAHPAYSGGGLGAYFSRAAAAAAHTHSSESPPSASGSAAPSSTPPSHTASSSIGSEPTSSSTPTGAAYHSAGLFKRRRDLEEDESRAQNLRSKSGSDSDSRASETPEGEKIPLPDSVLDELYSGFSL